MGEGKNPKNLNLSSNLKELPALFFDFIRQEGVPGDGDVVF
jgi:hypothetical protein